MFAAVVSETVHNFVFKLCLRKTCVGRYLISYEKAPSHAQNISRYSMKFVDGLSERPLAKNNEICQNRRVPKHARYAGLSCASRAPVLEALGRRAPVLDPLSRRASGMVSFNTVRVTALPFPN